MENELEPKKSKRGGARPNTGPKKPHSGNFQMGHKGRGPAVEKNKLMSQILRDIAQEPLSQSDKTTKGEVLMRKLFDAALEANASTIAGLKAIEIVHDRLEGKVKPSTEELDATKTSKQITVVLAPKNEQ